LNLLTSLFFVGIKVKEYLLRPVAIVLLTPGEFFKVRLKKLATEV